MTFTLEINPDDPQSVQRALNTEWLLTNGLGGYAMGTALGVNTRRYHGLLVAATKPPVGRVLALHSMIEQLVIRREDGTEEVVDLSTQQFVDGDGEPMLHPGGWRHLRSFEISSSDTAIWSWEFQGIELWRSVSMSTDVNLVEVNYGLECGLQHAKLRSRLFLAMRDFHSLESQGEMNWSVVPDRDGSWLKITSGEIAGDVESWNGRWTIGVQRWDRFAYVLDRSRRQDWAEHVWSPGYIEFTLEEVRQGAGFTASAFDRRFPVIGNTSNSVPGDRQDTRSTLSNAADQFVVLRSVGGTHSQTSIIAGYPWFGDWGRDTMISLPGLMLCMGRFEEAQSCLLLYAKNLRNGLIPNVFDDYGGAAHYNTADASLWFVHAVRELWTVSKNARRDKSAEELIAACREIVAAYRKGTDFNIFMDEDGLISAGDEGSQLTWMDAKRDGVVFTPRHGKAVEINALWFNALKCLEEMSEDERERRELSGLSRQAARSFREKFWWGERECLRDVLIRRETASGRRGFVADHRVRPNQIFAVSLPFSPLEEDEKRAVVKIVGERLLTPYGLRTLDRDDPEYRGRFEGNLFERDRAYHNGTVWPWLIGPYCEALLRVEKFSAAAKKRVRAILQPLLDELEVKRVENGEFVGGCLGQLAEVYDGDPPHRPGGCPAQAWSVAEVLRVLTLVS